MYNPRLRLMIAILLAIIFILPASARPTRRSRGNKAGAATAGQAIAQKNIPPVAAYFYYWYDYPSRAHIQNALGAEVLAAHPARFDGTFSYTNDNWWLKEFTDMSDAGIDIALMVYRGNASYPECEPWSNEGLTHLVKVLGHLTETGAGYPKVAMFYDTSSLSWSPGVGLTDKKPDLTSDETKETMALTINGFFKQIPQQYWALFEGKPIIWLNADAVGNEIDPGLFQYIRNQFLETFLVDPYIVADKAWAGAGEADAYFSDASSTGWAISDKIATLCPGYDNSKISPKASRILDREDSLLYQWDWMAALEKMPGMIVVDSWNDLELGTQICDTREEGRVYIDSTAYFADTLIFPEGEREIEIAELHKLFFDTVKLDPIEILDIDLNRGFIEFPVYIDPGKLNIYGNIRWVDNGSGVKITPPKDDFTLSKQIMRLDYEITKLTPATMMGPLPFLAGDFAAGGRDLPIKVKLLPALVRLVEAYPEGNPGFSIDGDLADWAGYQPLVIADKAYTSAGYTGWDSNDLSMEIYTSWGPEILYLAVATHDDIPLDGGKGRAMLETDSIQVAMELDDDRDGSIDPDKDLEFAMTFADGGARFYTMERPAGLAGPLDRLMRYAVKRTGNLTVYEMSIPVISCGIDPKAWLEGYKVGFNVVAHDDDGAGDEGFIRIAPGLGYETDTRRFARVVLMKD